MTTRSVGQLVDQERAEDIFFGQMVIIAARYFLIAGLVAVLLSSVSSSTQMALIAVPVIVFLAMNFFLHARYLTEQPANLALVVLTSVVDLVLVTGMVIFAPGEHGLGSPFFVLFYPLILAFAFVVPRRIEVLYTGLAMLLCAGSALIVAPGILTDTLELKQLVLRLITLAACGGIANFYWRTLRERRRVAQREFAH